MASGLGLANPAVITSSGEIPMAFQSNAQQAAAAPTNDSWKAQGFLNLYLPNKEGKRVKLGAIPLKDSKHSEKALIEWLSDDATREVRVATLLSKLIVEFKSATPGEGAGFDLG